MNEQKLDTTRTRDWNTGDREGPVVVGSCQLQLRASGPTRLSSLDPAIIIVHGLGGSWKEWRTAQDLISDFARVYTYERGGYIPNERPSNERTLPNIVAELKELLSNAQIKAPYLLVGHSFGGYIVRQFLLQHGDEIAGMVIKDSAPILTPFPKDWPQMLGSEQYENIIVRPYTCLPPDDFDVIASETCVNEKPGGISDAEIKHFDEYTRTLNDCLKGKQALGDRPLCVIFNNTGNDFRKAYEYGLEHGHGDAELRGRIRERLETFSSEDKDSMREHLVLSSNTKFVVATEEGTMTHNSHLVKPAFVVEQIRWAYQQCLASAPRSMTR